MKKNRELKVYESNGNNYKEVPEIVLKGEWVKKVGFSMGDKIKVECNTGRIVLSVVDAE